VSINPTENKIVSTNSTEYPTEKPTIHKKRTEKENTYNAISFDTENKKLIISADYKSKLFETYPNKDIETEIKKMELWLIDNPKRQKKNYGSFIMNWLNNSKSKNNNSGESEKNNFFDEYRNCKK